MKPGAGLMRFRILGAATVCDAWQFGASLRHTYISDACNDIDCNSQVFGFRTLDLNLFGGPQGESWWPQFGVGVDNLTDESGISGILSNQTLGDSTPDRATHADVRISGSF